jgi:Zn-dependent peptidase ImmA (M78 family)
MSTVTIDAVGQANATKVSPSFGAALEPLDVKAKAKIKKEAAEDAARILKATFPLWAPVGAVAIARKLDIQVLEAELDEDKLGVLLMKPGEESKILLNERDGFIRRRLTCALELGHYVRQSAKTNAYGRVDRRSDRSSGTEDPDLIYAEEFAACLLMSESEVRASAELGVDDLEMAIRFQVPREVAQLRLRDLGLLTVDLLVA